MVKTENMSEKILDDFETATVDLDSLNSFFCETRDMLNESKVKFENDTAYKISKILDEIYTYTGKDEKNKFIGEVQEKIIQDKYKLKDIIKILYDDDEQTLLYVLNEKFRTAEYDPKKARRKMFTIYNQDTIFTRAILSNIIIIFEKFLASSYEVLVTVEPQKYFEGKTIAVSKLINEKISDIINDTIKQEVESNMFDSLKTLDRIKEKSKVDIERYISMRDEFEEIYYRRNAYVHTNGCVNIKYLENVNPKYTKNSKIGDKLFCDDQYLENAILTVNKIIVSLHFEMLKFNKAKREDYDKLIIFAFESLKSNNYVLGEAIYGILRREKNFEYADKARFEVNYMLSIKEQGRNIDDLLKKFDVSIATPDFVIAKKCLEEDYESAYKILLKEYKNYFNAEAIREWPIFKGFRETEYYNKLIQQYHEDFEKFSFENEIVAENCCCTDNSIEIVDE